MSSLSELNRIVILIKIRGYTSNACTWVVLSTSSGKKSFLRLIAEYKRDYQILTNIETMLIMKKCYGSSVKI